MNVALVSHVNGDGDLLGAWFRHYTGLGVTSIHLIVHGARQENERLFELQGKFPVTIEQEYGGPFDSVEKKHRLNALLEKLRGKWIVLADSDEFVELPYRKLGSAIRALQMVGKDALFAPMLQRLTRDGSLETPEVIEDPFQSLPLCSSDLYQKIGVNAAVEKYPLFYCHEETTLQDGGNHTCPIGNRAASLRGVTHHFKFRRPVSGRLERRIDSTHPWRHESVLFRDYLTQHENYLPIEGAFEYSRKELFRRGLLRKLTLMTAVRYLSKIGSRLMTSNPAGW